MSGLFWVVAGVVCFAVGKFLRKNRLVIYQHGIVQHKRSGADVLLWRGIQQVYSERVTYYGSGLAYKSRYQCSLQRWDGTWLALNAIPITSQVMKALRENCEGNSRYEEIIQDF
jgi:hypothetical protein